MSNWRAIDLAGRKCGRLTPLRFLWFRNHNARWLCKCDCGSLFIGDARYLKSGNTRSCGCLMRETTATINHKHGGAAGERSGAYRSWASMKNRCLCPANHSFSGYGGRGITVCRRWRESFPAFLEDMGERPPGHSLERIDPNWHYCPSNCKWIPQAEQSRNTRATVRVVLNGETMVQAEAARRLGIHPTRLSYWVKHQNNVPAGVSLLATA